MSAPTTTNGECGLCTPRAAKQVVAGVRGWAVLAAVLAVCGIAGSTWLAWHTAAPLPIPAVLAGANGGILAVACRLHAAGHVRPSSKTVTAPEVTR